LVGIVGAHSHIYSIWISKVSRLAPWGLGCKVLSDSLTHLLTPGVALAPGSLRTGVVVLTGNTNDPP